MVITRTEQPGEYPDGTSYSLLAPTYEVLDEQGEPVDGLLVSPRIAPAVFGVGLLEGVPAGDILDLADPEDADGDGISGVARLVPDPDDAGRRAGARTLRLEGRRPERRAAERPRLRGGHRDHLVAPTRSALHAPASRVPERAERRRAGAGRPQARAGDLLHEDAGRPGSPRCRRRRTPRRDKRSSTSSAARAATSTSCARAPRTSRRWTVRPSAPTRTSCSTTSAPTSPTTAPGATSDAEWRTPPLWGIGLVETVNGHTRFLHDGRARNLEEAILWHGGEAEAARDAFLALDAKARAKLIQFLESL